MYEVMIAGTRMIVAEKPVTGITENSIAVLPLCKYEQ